ncbi:MAG TPA: hypothetical protein VK609_22980 [Mucilaginibacter sp.]|nr:hypothetical protein [Mucilaginibacter sp.]
MTKDNLRVLVDVVGEMLDTSKSIAKDQRMIDACKGDSFLMYGHVRSIEDNIKKLHSLADRIKTIQ